MSERCPTCGGGLRISKLSGKKVCRRCVVSAVDPAQAAQKQSASDEYEMVREIGRGSVGIIYLTREQRTGREVALKLFNAALNPDDTAHQRFLNETAIISSLDHTAIASVYGTGEIEGRPFFTMKYFEGGSLAEHIEDGWDATKAVDLMIPIAEGIHYAHSKGVLHRDLKPANILLDADGQPHLTDFGLAKRLEGSQLLTLTGTVIGSPAYMSPEQAAGETREITTLSDLFSLGMILFHLLTGRTPYAGLTHTQIIRAISETQPTFTREEKKRIPAGLRAICLKAIAGEPDKRYGSVRSFVNDLKCHRSGEPIEAKPPGVLSQGLRFVRQHVFSTIFGVGLLAALAAISSATVESLQQTVLRFIFSNRAGDYTYRFDDSMEGWVNVQVVSANGHPGVGFACNHGDEQLKPDYPGDGALTVQQRLKHGNSEQNQALWARSPKFAIPRDEPIEIAFCLGGETGRSFSAPESENDPRLFQPSVAFGWTGLLLRRVSDGHFILASDKPKISDEGPHHFTWTWEEIAKATANDSPDERYTFDLVDLCHGPYGWSSLFHLDIHAIE